MSGKARTTNKKVGRPPLADNNMLLSKRQTVRLTEGESEFLKTIAGKWSVAELIRHVIKEFIRRQENAEDKTCEKQT